MATARAAYASAVLSRPGRRLFACDRCGLRLLGAGLRFARRRGRLGLLRARLLFLRRRRRWLLLGVVAGSLVLGRQHGGRAALVDRRSSACLRDGLGGRRLDGRLDGDDRGRLGLGLLVRRRRGCLLGGRSRRRGSAAVSSARLAALQPTAAATGMRSRWVTFFTSTAPAVTIVDRGEAGDRLRRDRAARRRRARRPLPRRPRAAARRCVGCRRASGQPRRRCPPRRRRLRRRRRPAARTSCAAAGAASGEPAARGARAELRQEELLQDDQRADRVDGGEGAVRPAQLRAEQAAALAVLQVAAHRSGRPGKALGHLAELEPDLLAGEEPRLGRLGERYARAHEKRLDARHGGVHRLGDLVVGERVDLAQQQRGPLRLGQVLNVGDDLAELLAAVDGVGGRHAAVALEHVHRVEPGGDRAGEGG